MGTEVSQPALRVLGLCRYLADPGSALKCAPLVRAAWRWSRPVNARSAQIADRVLGFARSPKTDAKPLRLQVEALERPR